MFRLGRAARGYEAHSEGGVKEDKHPDCCIAYVDTTLRRDAGWSRPTLACVIRSPSKSSAYPDVFLYTPTDPKQVRQWCAPPYTVFNDGCNLASTYASLEEP